MMVAKDKHSAVSKQAFQISSRPKQNTACKHKLAANFTK